MLAAIQPGAFLIYPVTPLTAAALTILVRRYPFTAMAIVPHVLIQRVAAISQTVSLLVAALCYG